MRITNRILLPIMAYVAVMSLAVVDRTAETQSTTFSSTNTSANGERGPVSLLTRSQIARISRAQRNVNRLVHELHDARQKVLALRADAIPGSHYGEAAPVRVTRVAIVSDVAVLTQDANTIGFETNDSVVFVRRDANGTPIITGIGTVNRVYPNDLELQITSISKAAQVSPEDEVYVISRGDSPASLARWIK